MSGGFILRKLNFKGIFIGTLIAVVMSIIFILALTLWLCYGNLKESTVPSILLVISGISVATGAFLLARNITAGGLINGFLLSFFYLVILFVSSRFVGGTLVFDSSNIFRIIIILASGMLGGVLGINSTE